MTTQRNSNKSPKKAADPLTERAEQVRDSAQHIWLAGLGAFAKAQAEGAKVFDALVSEGQQLQNKTQTAAQARLSALSQATEQITEQVAGMANGLSDKASGQWNKLENIFENRVATALFNLGMPSAPDIVSLQARIEALEERIEQMHAQAASSKTRSRASTSTAKSPQRSVPTGRARKN